MRQVFGEWGVVTETKSTSYGILSAPVASTIRGISHIVSGPARKELSARCTLRFVETVFLNRLKGMFFDIHSITIWRYPFLCIKQADIRIRKSFPGFIKKG